MQEVPHDVWDYDAISPVVLMDVKDSLGRMTPAAAQAGKTGWIYVVDRATGKPIRRTDAFVPQQAIFSLPTRTGTRVLPGGNGGSEWSPTAYSPQTGYMYVLGLNEHDVYKLRPEKYRAAASYLTGVWYSVEPDKDNGTFTAVDLSTGHIAWQDTLPDPMIGGAMATAGGLVFVGTKDKRFIAYDARTGKNLWHYAAPAGVNAPAGELLGRRTTIRRGRGGRQFSDELTARRRPARLRAPRASAAMNTRLLVVLIACTATGLAASAAACAHTDEDRVEALKASSDRPEQFLPADLASRGDSNVLARHDTLMDTDEEAQPDSLPPLPFGMTLQMIRDGDRLFRGKGGCVNCHGSEAQGLPARGKTLTAGLHFLPAGDWRGVDSIIAVGLPDAVTRSPVAMPPRGQHGNLEPRGDPRDRRVRLGHQLGEGRAVAGRARRPRAARPARLGAHEHSVMTAHLLFQLRAYYDRDPSTMSAASRNARDLASLGTAMIVAGTLVFLLVVGLMAWGLWRRHSETTDGPPLPISENRWVIGGGFAMPVVVLAGVFVATLLVLRARETPPPGAEEVLVIGHQWWWEVRYPHDTVVTADEIHIPVGRAVRVRLQSNDVIHSFWAPNLDGKTDVIPGQENHMVLRADSAGVYRAECAEYCGVQHAHMSLSVVAEAPAMFDRWLANAKAPAPPVKDEAQAAGLAAFMDHSCSFCHTIRGTQATGTVGPDLTHLGSRLTLAGGTLPNTVGNLAGWIANPDRLKPGVKMPAVPMDGASLQAIVQYLESLK